MQKLYRALAVGYFVAATLILMLLAICLLVVALYDATWGLMSGAGAAAALDAIAILIIGFAVMETANFIAEEEIMRKRELRSSRESRRSITKFITIIVIAMSLEALVMVFRTSSDDIRFAIYPTALFFAAMFALVALGIYQWLSSRIGDDAEETAEIEHDDRREKRADARKKAAADK